MSKIAPLTRKSLLTPSTKPPRGRRLWSIDLETVWLPWLTATNVTGDTAIPAEALGCPIRLAYEKDGSVKFSQSGKPVTKVVKPISATVTLVRENFVAHLLLQTNEVITERQKDYAKQIEMSTKAGKALIDYDQKALDHAIQLRIEAELEQARCAEAEAERQAEPEPELVTAQ